MGVSLLSSRKILQLKPHARTTYSRHYSRTIVRTVSFAAPVLHCLFSL
jgi:hypothetical protein